jgi:TolB protein
MPVIPSPRVVFLMAFTGCFAVPGHAQVEVQKTGRPLIKVEAIGGSDGAKATRVLAADLQRTMMIDAGKPGKSDFVASGTFADGGLLGKLVDGSGSEVLNKTYTGPWRRATHEFADDITFAATGVKGFAASRVAFISAHTGKKELYVMDIDGDNLLQLTQDKTISNGPAWSHDGRLVAYTSYKSGYPDVYVIDLERNQRNRVAAFPGINSGPAFSPDDKMLALTLSKDGNPEIYTMPAAGGEPRRVTRTRGTETSPSWSPDGAQLVFSSDDRGNPQLHVAPFDGGESMRLRTSAGFDTEPDWSADGKQITLTLRVGGAFQIGVYNMETRETLQLTTSGGEDSSWTPNSRHIVYAHSGSLYLLDSATKETARLQCGVTKITEPAVSK